MAALVPLVLFILSSLLRTLVRRVAVAVVVVDGSRVVRLGNGIVAARAGTSTTRMVNGRDFGTVSVVIVIIVVIICL